MSKLISQSLGQSPSLSYPALSPLNECGQLSAHMPRASLTRLQEEEPGMGGPFYMSQGKRAPRSCSNKQISDVLFATCVVGPKARLMAHLPQQAYPSTAPQPLAQTRAACGRKEKVIARRLGCTPAKWAAGRPSRNGVEGRLSRRRVHAQMTTTAWIKGPAPELNLGSVLGQHILAS
jgi:hypothetical protein